jgi:Cu(I)/Ag(I) efflux system membrane fusion protein
MYSPDLISSEREYLLALENLQRVEKSGFAEAVRNARELVNSTRQRLLWLGLSEQQLDQIAESRQLDEHIKIYAPQGGTVIEKKAYPGQYVKEGDVLFNIADLSRVWLYADIYEDEIPFLYQERPGDYFECAMHPNQRSDAPGTCRECGMDFIRANRSIVVEIEPRAFPGESFEGYISFTDPFLNPETRTVRVRVNVENPDSKLKPGMFARARIRLPAGKMLAVPESAVIHSGTRTIVLVEEEEGKFRPTLVKLGRMWLNADESGRADDTALAFKKGSLRFHEVLGGLAPREHVVTSGNFLVGSESQLQGALAKMVADVTEPQAGEHDHGAAEIAAPKLEETNFPVILDAYLSISEKLAGDTVEGISPLAQKIAESSVNEGIKNAAAPLRIAAEREDIDRVRYDFRRMSDVMIAYIAAHKEHVRNKPNKVYCPMADATWLQKGTTIKNPYYGASMLRCGKIESWDG